MKSVLPLLLCTTINDVTHILRFIYSTLNEIHDHAFAFKTYRHLLMPLKTKQFQNQLNLFEDAVRSVVSKQWHVDVKIELIHLCRGRCVHRHKEHLQWFKFRLRTYYCKLVEEGIIALLSNN